MPKSHGPEKLQDDLEIFVAPPESGQSPVRLVEKEDTGDRVLIYSTDEGINIELRVEGDTFWASQKQMAEMFGASRQNINKHLTNIYEEGELSKQATCKDSLQVQLEGNRKVNRTVLLHNLDALISIGYRVNSKQGTMFRIWATDKLVQILTKGFYIDKERLKNPEQDSILDELRDTIREIRASTQNVYRKVKDLCTLCSDYNGSSQEVRYFFSSMENKLLWASCQMTAAEIIMNRADISKPDMGLTYFTGKRAPIQKDVTVGTNYLAEGEGKVKNRITTMWLDYVEEQLDQGRMVTMEEVSNKLNEFIKFNNWPLLTHRGKIKKAHADKHACLLLKQYKEQLKENSI